MNICFDYFPSEIRRAFLFVEKIFKIFLQSGTFGFFNVGVLIADAEASQSDHHKKDKKFDFSTICVDIFLGVIK